MGCLKGSNDPTDSAGNQGCATVLLYVTPKNETLDPWSRMKIRQLPDNCKIRDALKFIVDVLMRRPLCSDLGVSTVRKSWCLVTKASLLPWPFTAWR